jgi:Flp pilus assembly protein TadG
MLGRAQDGTTAVEFALVSPVLILLLFGLLKAGLALFNFLQLSNAVSSGVRQFSMSRDLPTPLTSTTSLMQSAAPNLASGSFSISPFVNGTLCSSDAACAGALTLGATAKIVATYPCDLVVVGHDFLPGCKLSAAGAARVE